jgi:hypothetical protein
MADFDPYSALLADEPTALEMAKARAAALRGQNYAGIVMGLAHDPQAAKMGGELMQQAQTGQTQLGEMPGQRMQRLLQQQALQKQQFDAAGMQSPEYGVAGRALLQKFGLPVADATPNPAVQAILPIAEKAYAADLAAQARRETARLMATGGASLTPEALEQAANMYSTTGALPQLGAGRAGANLKTAIANKAAQLTPTANLAANKAGYKADTGSLAKMQAQTDAMNAFEHTALANLDQFLEQAKTVVDTGSPLFNAPARKFMEKVAGDPKMTQFNAARQVAVQEISKVLGGSLGGVVSDSARHEAASLIGPDASLAQIEAAAKILRRDMENRRKSMEQEIGGIRARTGGQAAPAAPAEAAAPAAPPANDLRKKYGL